MRQITRPLPDTHPEFTVVSWRGFTEYRVEHYRLARDGTGRIVCGTCVWSWLDAGVVTLVALIVRAWFEARGEGGDHGPVSVLVAAPCHVLVVGIGIVLTWLVWTRCTQVLHESLLVFPTLGIQLETHRGHPLLPSPLSITRHFIPLSALEDVVVHEGFRRWDVRYYLAALQRRGRPLASALALAEAEARGFASVSDAGSGSVSLLSATEAATPGGVVEIHVAFENILPYFLVLKVVYLGVQEALFPPPTRVVETDGLVQGIRHIL